LAAASQGTAFAQALPPSRYVDDPIPLQGWVSAEYLAWWMRGQSTGPLVTSNPSATPFVGDPGTVVLLGDDRIHNRASSGVRFTVGTWINGDSTTGVEFGAFYLNPRSTQFTAASD